MLAREKTRRLLKQLIPCAAAAVMLTLTAGPAYSSVPAGHPAQAAGRTAAPVPRPHGAKGTYSCRPGTPGSSVASRCVRVRPISAGQLNAADRGRRHAALAQVAAEAKAKKSPLVISALPLRRAPASAGAITPPTQCGFGSLVNFAPDRFTACGDQTWELDDIQIDSDGTTTVVGFMEMEDLQWFSYSATSETWAHDLLMMSYTGDGTLADGFDAEISSACDANPAVCVAFPPGTPDPQTVAVTPESSYEFSWTEQDQGPGLTTPNGVTELYGYTGVNFEGSTPVGGPWTFSDGSFGGRCDSVATAADGCIDDEYVPTVIFDSTANPAVAPVAQHIYDAQNGGLTTAWGVDPSLHSNGAYLSRDMNPADNTANNRAACGSVTVPPGSNCDEFPMASTYEGAAFNSDYSVAIVPSSANSSQGGILGNFYSSNRVIDNDLFMVVSVLPNGTASW